MAEETQTEKKITSFSDPALSKIFDAGIKNSEALRKKETPTENTDSPDDKDEKKEEAADAKEKAEDQKPPEHTPEAPADPPFTPKKASDWNKLRETLTAKHSTEVEALKKELEEARSDKTRKQLEDQLEEYRREIQAIAVERDPVFRKEWDAKQQAATARLKQIAPEIGEQLANVAGLPPSAHKDALIQGMIEKLEPWKQGAIGAAMMDVVKLSGEKEALVKRTQEQLALEAQQIERARQTERARQFKSFDDEAKEWHETFEAWGDDVEKSKIDSAINLARSAFGGEAFKNGNGQADFKKLARFAMWGGIGPILATQLDTALKRIETLEKANKALQGGQAKASAASAATTESEEEKMYAKGMSLGDIVAHQAKKAGLTR